MEGGRSHRRHALENMDIQSWSIIKDGDGKEFVVKSYFNMGTSVHYDVLLYDGMDVWAEDIDEDTFKKKCKEYNPNIEAKLPMLLNHVKKSLQDCSTANIKNSTSTEVQLIVESKLQAGLPFHWTFLLKKCQTHTLNKHIVNPMFVMVKELFRRQQELFNLLEMKDREILDHQDQGSFVSRKHLQTRPFQRNIFQTTSNVDENFLSYCENSSCIASLSSPEVSDLYRSVMLNTQKQQNIAVTSSATFDTVETSAKLPEHAPSWSGRVPDSIGNEQDAHIVSNETIPLEQSPVEDIEQERREALRKRLEEESMRKKKKKKRKLNI